MSRLLELTVAAVDGPIPRTEEEELDRLARATPEATRAHLDILELEVTLRRLRPEQATASDLVDAVLGRIGPDRPPRRRRTTVLVAAGISMTAVAVLLLAPGLRSRRDRPAAEVVAEAPPPPATTPIRPPAAVAEPNLEVAKVSAQVTLHRGRRVLRFGPSTTVESGDIIDIPASASLIIGNAPRLATMGGAVRLRVLADRTLAVDKGTVEARSEEARPLPLQTPHGWALLTAGRGLLRVHDELTRLEVYEGSARFGNPQDPGVEVTQGHFAQIVGTEKPTVHGLGAAFTLVPPVAVPDDEGTVLLSFDFEDALLPPAWSEGDVVIGPPRDGSRYCLGGTAFQNAPHDNSVKIEDALGQGVTLYSPELVLRFDYWVGPEAERLVVQVRHVEQRQNYNAILPRITTGRWAQATLRLSDLKPIKRKNQSMKPGDHLSAILIVGGRRAETPLFIDNVHIVQFPLDKLPATHP